MKCAVYVSRSTAPMFRENFYNPKSGKSLEKMAEEVQSILIFEEEISDEISLFDWLSHPAYIATINGDWKFLKSMFAPLGYEVRTIPIN